MDVKLLDQRRTVLSLMSGDSPLSPSVISGVLAILFLLTRWLKARQTALHAIPTVGYSDPLLSYISAIRYYFESRAILQEGYEKYKPGLFKIPMLNHWEVIVTGPQLIEDIRKAPDSVLSFEEAIAQTLHVDYTLGPEIRHNPYHIPIIRSQLTRNLAGLFADVRDELVSAFHDVIPAKDEWIKVEPQDALQRIVCRTSNRAFVGNPLCRNEDYQQLNIEFTIDVVKGAIVLNLCPGFLRPLVAPFATNIPKQLQRQIRHVAPVIEERRRQLEEHGGEWEDQPNDMLAWLMDQAKGVERSTRSLALRLLTINFAAIHTSSLSFTHALYHLAANPEYMAPLREEVEAVVAAEGWTKVALQKMRKVDSFVRESQRFNGLGLVNLERFVMQPFTFSNGVTVPAGTFVSCASAATHTDDAHYAHADVFDPFRFADMREEDGGATKHQMVSTQSNFLVFGYGRHACPGRFFAADELKAMLAHLVLTYDVKFEDGKGFPPNVFIASSCIPGKREVLFRRRQT